MPFNSDTFLFAFLPLTLAGFAMLGAKRPGAGAAWLVAASLVFYAWWNPRDLWVVAASALFNFIVAIAIARAARGSRRRKALLAAGVAADVAFLFAFKALASPWFGAASIDGAAYSTAAAIAIPLGVSFITFQQIAFLVDVHRGRIERPRALEYAFFLLFFPKLVCGPIVHYRDIAPQLSKPGFGRIGALDLACGLAILAVGLAKKVLLADGIAPYVDAVFAAVARGDVVAPAHAFLGAIGFQLQIYFDFSGYADMAIGVARMFGVRLPVNFDAPLRSVDRFDFWRRWHLTFAAFLREYIFHPLVRNRVAPVAPWAALFVTAFLGGVWHGLGATFVAWSLVQALLIVGQHALKSRLPVAPPPRAAAAAYIAHMLVAVLVGAVLAIIFRAPDIATAVRYLAQLVPAASAGAQPAPVPLSLWIAAIVGWGGPTTQSIFSRYWTALEPRAPRDIPAHHEPLFGSSWRFAPDARWAMFAAALLFLSIVWLDRTARNVYFQF